MDQIAEARLRILHNFFERDRDVWRVIEEDILDEIEGLKDALTVETDHHSMRVIQGQIKAYRTVLFLPDAVNNALAESDDADV